MRKYIYTQTDEIDGKPDTATSCKSGFEASLRKPTVVIQKGAEGLAYLIQQPWTVLVSSGIFISPVLHFEESVI